MTLHFWPQILSVAPRCAECSIPLEELEADRCPVCREGGLEASLEAVSVGLLASHSRASVAPSKAQLDALARFLLVVGWRAGDRVIVRLPTGTVRSGMVTAVPDPSSSLFRFGYFVAVDSDLDPGPGPTFVPAKWLLPILPDVLTAAGEVLDDLRRAEGSDR